MTTPDNSGAADGEPAGRVRQRRRPTPLTVMIGIVVVALAATAIWGLETLSSQWSCRAKDASLLTHTDGVLYGVNLDWGSETVAEYQQNLGHAPGVAAQFTDLPYTDTEWTWVTEAATQINQAGGVLLLTLEPNGGLNTVTDAVVNRLTDDLRTLNDQGVPVVLRFAHEMNGSWYAWSQQPQAYVAAFRKVAQSVHQRAPGTAMLWAPNYGGGYPFRGGKYNAKPGTPAFAALDTNHDGVLTMADDPYQPYYPGDDAVDWVGMSLYHWGNHYPWGSNDIPEPGKLSALLTGTYSGSVGNETSVPNFYQVYGVDHARPVAITETAAFYAPANKGASELAIKQAWWQQVFSDDLHQEFPMLKMINWFEWNKYEPEVSTMVDWRALGPNTRTEFTADLPSWLLFGHDVTTCSWGFA
ncbi:MAG TPA: glycosyl hydrolase [Propionicimonas sp.]|nr:glycosyl hydrolase [Propionicimonas sp.]